MTTALDRPFNQLLFRLYASDLSEAIYDLSRETMGATSNLRGQLGIDNVGVRFGNNRQFVIMTNPDGSETTVELDVTAPTDEIARALNVQKINDVTAPPSMSITGFQPGAIRAKLDAIKKKAAERRTQAMAKLDTADAKLASVDAAIELYAAKIEKEGDDGLQEFATFTNGGPA